MNWQPIAQLLSQGGPILWVLIAIAGLSWFFIIERWFFIRLTLPKIQHDVLAHWQQRAEHNSWYASAIREAWEFDVQQKIYRFLNIIKLLIALCPMLGLLGTVTGMIEIFATISINDPMPQQLATGISRAILPTFAGMLFAAAGLFSYNRLLKLCSRKSQFIIKQLANIERNNDEI